MPLAVAFLSKTSQLQTEHLTLLPGDEQMRTMYIAPQKKTKIRDIVLTKKKKAP